MAKRGMASPQAVLALIGTEADQQDGVIDLLPLLVNLPGARLVDPVLVVHEVLLGLEGHHHRAVLHELVLDGGRVTAAVVAADVVVVDGAEAGCS